MMLLNGNAEVMKKMGIVILVLGLLFGLMSAGSSDPNRASSAKTPKVTQTPNELWWFNGQTPSGYATTATVTYVAPAAGETPYTFSVLYGPVTIVSTTASSAVIRSSGKTGGPKFGHNVKLKLVSATGKIHYVLTFVKAPDRMVFLGNNDDFADLSGGWITYIGYRILDQFGASLPRAVVMNEDFTSGKNKDDTNSNWPMPSEGSWTTDSNAVWSDNFRSGYTNAYTPSPIPKVLYPNDPNINLKVDNYTGHFYVGSTNLGQGVTTVSSHWNNSNLVKWQRRRGYGRHNQ